METSYHLIPCNRKVYFVQLLTRQMKINREKKGGKDAKMWALRKKR